MNKYTTMLVGCGSIGALKPCKYDSPSSNSTILTWAHALYVSKQTKDNIVFIDQDFEKAKEAYYKWSGVAYYSDIRQGMSIYHPEIIIVAVDTENHSKVIEEILRCIKYGCERPELLIVEKPFCNSFQEASHISERLKSNDIPVMVNYSRRFLPRVMEFKNLLDTQEYIDPKIGIEHCRVIYGRGLKREACHAIDLMRFLFGEFREGRILNPKCSLDDYSEKDRTYAAYLSFEKCPHVFLTPVDGREMSVFEIDIFGKHHRSTFIDHGAHFNYFPKIAEPIYGNYLTISPLPSKRLHTGLTKSLEYALTNAIDYIEKPQEVKLFCTDNDAIEVHRILESLYSTI